MTDKTSPRLILSFGQKEILTDATTAYVRATLDRLLPALAMPDSEAFDFVEQARIDAQAGMTWDSAPLDDEADDLANGLMQEFFDYQQFLKRQVRDFAFAALFHLLERTVRKILMEANRTYGGAVLKTEKDTKSFKGMLSVLARCGYVTDEQPFARDLHKLNLISNAIKHGHGHSLTKLSKEFPDLFLHREPNEPLVLDHLFLTPELLRQLAASVAAFWGAFPAQQFKN